MLQPSAISENWTIREKLCLASCVMKMNENWSSISKQMKQMTDVRRPAEFFSQKNCAQQYTNLVETLGPQKRRRTSDSSSTSDSIAAQLVSKLSLDRLDELKQIINQEKLLYKKMRKEIEAIRSGECDHQLEIMLEQIEHEERDAGLINVNLENYSRESFLDDVGDVDEDVKHVDTIAPPVNYPPPSTIAQSPPFRPAGKYEEFSSPTSVRKDWSGDMFSTPVVGSATSPFVGPKSPTQSPSKTPSTPISVLAPGPPTTSPSLSPISVFTQLSPTKSVTQSPPQKVENLSLTRPEMVSPEITVKEEPAAGVVPLAVVDVAPKIEPKPLLESCDSKEDSRDSQKIPLRTNEPLTFARRHKRDSGGSTNSDASSAMAAGDSVSSRSPHPVPPHFPDLEFYRTWKRTMLNVFNVAAGHKHANLFYKPVTSNAPRYNEVIYRPMCLYELKKAIDNQVVTTEAEFRRDLLLIFANAVMYNSSSHDVHKMAAMMAQDVLPRMDELLAPQTPKEATPGKSLRILRGAVSTSTPTSTLEKSTRKRERESAVETSGAESAKRVKS